MSTLNITSSGSSTFTMGRPIGRQDRDFCIKHGLVHAWKSPEFSLSTSPKTEYCENCGRERRWVPGYWKDVSE